MMSPPLRQVELDELEDGSPVRKEGRLSLCGRPKASDKTKKSVPATNCKVNRVYVEIRLSNN